MLRGIQCSTKLSRRRYLSFGRPTIDRSSNPRRIARISTTACLLGAWISSAHYLVRIRWDSCAPMAPELRELTSYHEEKLDYDREFKPCPPSKAEPRELPDHLLCDRVPVGSGRGGTAVRSERIQGTPPPAARSGALEIRASSVRRRELVEVAVLGGVACVADHRVTRQNDEFPRSRADAVCNDELARSPSIASRSDELARSHGRADRPRARGAKTDMFDDVPDADPPLAAIAQHASGGVLRARQGEVASVFPRRRAPWRRCCRSCASRRR